jgi:hypothetical protein
VTKVINDIKKDEEEKKMTSEGKLRALIKSRSENYDRVADCYKRQLEVIDVLGSLPERVRETIISDKGRGYNGVPRIGLYVTPVPLALSNISRELESGDAASELIDSGICSDAYALIEKKKADKKGYDIESSSREKSYIASKAVPEIKEVQRLYDALRQRIGVYSGINLPVGIDLFEDLNGLRDITGLIPHLSLDQRSKYYHAQLDLNHREYVMNLVIAIQNVAQAIKGN